MDFAQSRILEVHGERMLKRTFAPGFRIELHAKDLAIVLAGARALQVPLPAHRALPGIVQRLIRGRRRRTSTIPRW